MPEHDLDSPVQPSVHHRLLGYGQSGDKPYTAARCRDDILRDVAALLNTRTPFAAPLDPTYPEAADSILTFGRPEIALLSIHQEMSHYAQKVKEMILRFDPRFEQVEIESIGVPTAENRTLRLRIRAKLRLQQVSRLEFDSEMDFGTGQVQVKRVR